MISPLARGLARAPLARAGLWLLGGGLLALLVAISADARQAQLALQSCSLVAGTVALSLLVGVPLALVLTRTDLPGRRFYRVCLAGLVFVPLYVQAAAWQAALGPQGWAAGSLTSPPLLHGLAGAVLVHAAAAVPWIVLILGYELRRVPRSLEELYLLERPPSRVMALVTLPLVAPAVAAAGLWTAVVAAGEVAVTDLLQVRTWAEEIYADLSLGHELAATWNTWPTLLALVWLCAGGWLLAGATRRRSQREARPLVFRLGTCRWPVAVAAAVCVAGVAGMPLGSLAFQAGATVERSPGGWNVDWSLAKCARMVLVDAPGRHADELGWSLLIGGLAAAAAVALALPLAWWARRSRCGMLLVLLLMAVLLAVPGPLAGLAIVQLFSGLTWSPLAYLYDQTIAAPWLAQLWRALPAALLVLGHALWTLPRQWLEQAALEGARPRDLLCRVVVPARRRDLAAAFLVGLAVAQGELAATVLTAPPGVTTLAIRIAQQSHYGVDDQLAGSCLLVVLFSLGLAAALAWLLGGRAKSAGSSTRRAPAAPRTAAAPGSAP